MVFLQPKRQKIPDRAEDEPSDRGRLLESDRERPRSSKRCKWSPTRDEENPSFLQGSSSERRKDEMGHARVSPRGRLLVPPHGQGNSSQLARLVYIYFFGW